MVAFPNTERLRWQGSQDLILRVLFILGLLFLPARAAKKSVGEYELKAAVLLNIAKFAEWPEDKLTLSDESFRIGLLGEDPFGDRLNQLAKDKTVKGRPVAILRVDSIEVTRDCHVLFLSGTERGRLSAHLQRLDGAPVLTLSDTQGFAQQGVMVNMVLTEGKVRFEINKRLVEKAGIVLSSKVLRYAKIIE